jgi:hypothetical protein
MKKSIQTQVYKRLIDDITALYDVARHALVEAYLLSARLSQVRENRQPEPFPQPGTFGQGAGTNIEIVRPDFGMVILDV